MTEKLIKRPPVVSVMGHVDHGKSSILDYIRKSNIVEKEFGGITQHVSAYEVEHEYEGQIRKITFLDTPGHEAFRAIRQRGASVADVAILVVAADDGVKPQTIDALNSIKEAKIPFVVAINKIDKPEANVQKVQNELLENEIYLEGMGGDVPYVLVSAKTGEGIDDLLDTILLLADLQDLKANPDNSASGVVIESNKDTKRGISATLIIKDGTLKRGQFVLAESAWAPVRIFEDFQGKSINEASFSSPVKIVGFNEMPELGVMFKTVESRKEAEQEAEKAKLKSAELKSAKKVERKDKFAIPVLVCADTIGSKEAIIYELNKLETQKSYFDIISATVGPVSKDDVEMAFSANRALILAFNVKTDNAAKDLAKQMGVEVKTFKIIYELTDFAKEYLDKKSPKLTVEEEIGVSKILKIFSESKKGAIVGGKVVKGCLKLNSKIKIKRRGTEIGEGTVSSLQSNKQDTDKVEEGGMFGAQLNVNTPLMEGDELIVIEEKEL